MNRIRGKKTYDSFFVDSRRSNVVKKRHPTEKKVFLSAKSVFRFLIESLNFLGKNVKPKSVPNMFTYAKVSQSFPLKPIA